jgi:hypothetical protein
MTGCYVFLGERRLSFPSQNKKGKLGPEIGMEPDGVVFRKEWYRKTGKEVMEGRPLLHRLLGFKGRCKGCLQLIITDL